MMKGNNRTTNGDGTATTQARPPSYGAINLPPTTATVPIKKERWHPPGWVFLALFVLVYSANDAVLTKLVSLGEPFTICNILCIGNTMGILTLFPIFHKELTWDKIKEVKWWQWGLMVLGSFLANVLGSLSYLQGLIMTSVPASAIMHRLEAVDFLVASALFLGDRHGAWVITNASLVVLGVIFTVIEPYLLEGQPFNVTHGLIFLFLGGWLYTTSLLITKKYLVYVNLGILVCFKVSVGTFLFHTLSVIRHHTQAFMIAELYSTRLWLAMLWYGPLFVTSTQVLWLYSVKYCSPTMLSVGMNTNFIMTVTWGVLVLGRYPSKAEALGGSLIFISTLSGMVEALVYRDREKGQGIEQAGAKARPLAEEVVEAGGAAPPTAASAAVKVQAGSYHLAEEWVRRAVDEEDIIVGTPPQYIG